MILIVLLLMLMLGIGLPIAFSIWIYKSIEKSTWHPAMRLIALIPVTAVGYLIYDAVFPGDDFYRSDYKTVCGIELHERAEIEYKTASFPDIHGDYTSVAIIEIGETSYNNLPHYLEKRGLTKNDNVIGANEMDKALRKLGSRTIVKEYSLWNDSQGLYYVAFYPTGKQSLCS